MYRNQHGCVVIDGDIRIMSFADFITFQRISGKTQEEAEAALEAVPFKEEPPTELFGIKPAKLS